MNSLKTKKPVIFADLKEFIRSPLQGLFDKSDISFGEEFF
jgi:hypothetical protein